MIGGVLPLHTSLDVEEHLDLLSIEGTLRHQDNIKNAKSKYGDIFNGKIISTKYFDNYDILVPTLVCSDDINLVLGKPTYPENFTDDEYKIKLVNRFNIGYTVEVSKK